MSIPFAILHHTGIDEPHYDLLLAFPGEPLLRTWRIFPPPQSWLQNPPPAMRLSDHRPVYLTFEGDISGNRGHVRRILEGSATLLEESEGSCTLHLAAEDFSCTLTLPL